MSTLPARPEEYPGKWIMVFWYFDKKSASFNLSQPRPFNSKKDAIAAANGAISENGNIRVLYGYAYPPVSVNDQPYVINLQ